jgi:putative membrane protein
MWIFPVILVIVLLLVVYLILRRGGFRPPRQEPTIKYYGGKSNSETPVDILKKRYAKGEITSEESEQMKADISD